MVKGWFVNHRKLNGEFFANFIRVYFKLTLAKAGPKLMASVYYDNDPSQTSRSNEGLARYRGSHTVFLVDQTSILLRTFFILLKRDLKMRLCRTTLQGNLKHLQSVFCDAFTKWTFIWLIKPLRAYLIALTLLFASRVAEQNTKYNIFFINVKSLLFSDQDD